MYTCDANLANKQTNKNCKDDLTFSLGQCCIQHVKMTNFYFNNNKKSFYETVLTKVKVER